MLVSMGCTPGAGGLRFESRQRQTFVFISLLICASFNGSHSSEILVLMLTLTESDRILSFANYNSLTQPFSSILR